MSAGAIDELMQNWATRPGASNPPFTNHTDLYNTINATEIGHVLLYIQLANPDFKSEMDFAPKRVFVGKQREYNDFMSGNWAWKQADIIVEDPTTHGSMFVPIILVTLIGFLTIPKTDRENQDSTEFRTFRRNLFHGSLLQSLKPGMTVPEVTLFADGHYRRAIHRLSPYIADYPEQMYGTL
ncbi:hypothetical protein B0H13DRAFT_2327804 [Mycena leptocephala]|nr:hypothetical protein B0H13DRAFT_2327804 [Mycena leptocephala]